MSILTTARTKARHRGKSVTTLQKEIDTRECEVVRLNLLLDELGTAYLNLQTAHRTAVAGLETQQRATRAANERTRRLDGELAETRAQVRRLTADLTALRATIQPRDTSNPVDQTTEPIDVRALRATIPAGPVIPVMPLPEAPFAMDRPDTSPTDLPGETTLTLRITAA